MVWAKPKSMLLGHAHPSAIVGAGPAGLLLGQLLLKEGISNVVLERQTAGMYSAGFVLGSSRAAQPDFSRRPGYCDRLHRESLLHAGIEIASAGARHRVNFRELIGREVVVYGQTEITRDLMAAREGAGGSTIYEAEDVTLQISTASIPASLTETIMPSTASTVTSSPAVMVFAA